MKDKGSKRREGVVRGILPSSFNLHPSTFLSPRPRQIYLPPTPACVPLVAVLLAMAYAALSQKNAGAYLLGFFLASLTIISIFHAHFALTGLRVKVGPIEPTFAGCAARVPVTLENPTHRTRRAILQVARAQNWRWPWQRKLREPDEGGVPAPEVATRAPLLRGGRAELVLPVPARGRGKHALGALVVSTTYPLGFFRGLFHEPTDAGFLVYPAPAGTRPPPTPPAAAAFDFTPGAPSTAGDDYAGARTYLPGDSQRHVDWRAAARGRGLLVKQFAGAGREPLWLDWRDLDELGPDATEARLSQLCRWVLDAEAAPANGTDGRELSYGLRLPGAAAIPLGRGEAHLHRCLRALALWKNV